MTENENVLSPDGTMIGRPEPSASEGKHFFDKPRGITWCMKSAFLRAEDRRLEVESEREYKDAKRKRY
jgi:hypothetical protein